MTDRSISLWRHSDFLKLWLGQTISLLGSQVTLLALSLTAVLLLKATAIEMGFLAAAQTAPSLLFGLVAGVWVDRLRRRSILIAADVGRACVLASIPVTSTFGVLSLWNLYIVAFVAGVLTVFFEVAYQSYLPSLISREHLTEGNSRLELSRSVTQTVGPALAGALVQLLTAPIAIIADAVSFGISALSLGLISTREQTRLSNRAEHAIWREIADGLRWVLGNPVLRSLTGCAGTFNLFSNAMGAVYVLYATRDLDLAPAVLGVLFAVFGPSSILGIMLARWAPRRLGLGTAITAAVLLFGTGDLLVPLAAGPTILVIAMLAGARLLEGLSIPIYVVNSLSLRQAITPDSLQGRVNATARFVTWGTIPIGALLGGTLGGTIGLRSTLLVAVAGLLLSSLWLLLSPVRALREAHAAS